MPEWYTLSVVVLVIVVVVIGIVRFRINPVIALGVGAASIGLLTGLGQQGDLGGILQGYFAATTWAPILVVWAMAALLHIAVGSVTLSAITAAGIIAPAAASLGLSPLIVALAAGAGALFCIHVTSNTFWLLKSFLGQSVRGALKTVTLGVSLASVIALGMTLILAVFV